MKSFFRILKFTLPKSALVCSLTSSFKSIRLEDNFSQQNSQTMQLRNTQLSKQNYKNQIQTKLEKQIDENSKSKTQSQDTNTQIRNQQIKKQNNLLTINKTQSNQFQRQGNQEKTNKQQQKEFNQSQKNPENIQGTQVKKIIDPPIQSNQQQKKQGYHLNQNTAVIGKDVPNYIFKYLISRGLKVKTSQELDPENIILHTNEKQQKTFKLSSGSSKDILWEISNFLSPIKQIKTLNDAQQLLKSLQKDQSIISAYIPNKNYYQKQFQEKTRSIFDSFTKSFYLNVQQLQSKFILQKHLNSSKKNQFVIIRNKQAAQFLKVNVNKIGMPHILYNSYELTGNQPNCKIQNKNYTCHNLQRFIKAQNPGEQKLGDKISQITNQYICNINVKQDLIDKIRQIQQTNFKGTQIQQTNLKDSQTNNQKRPNKKLLVVKLDDQKKQFQNDVHKILIKVSKLMKNQVIIVKTQNQQILRQVLHISPDDYATVRLIDVSKELPSIIGPMFKQNKSQQNKKKSNKYPFYLRYVMKGPFQIQNICQFISNCQLNEPFYQKNIEISNIKPFYPGEFKNFMNGAVLFQKYGCNGCSLSQNLLSKVIKLQSFINLRNHKLSNQIRMKYKIEETELFAKVKIKKYNILNEDSQYYSPQNTPKLMVYDKQYRQNDIKIDQVFNILKNIEKGQSQQKVHDAMIQQIIQRMSKNLLQE